jgi:hypothetical protein
MATTPEQATPEAGDNDSGAKLAAELSQVTPAEAAAPSNKSSETVDTTDPSYAVKKFRDSGPPVSTDASGYGNRAEYPHTDLESHTTKANREAQWRANQETAAPKRTLLQRLV